jgi:GDP-L-fucose synthase
LNKDEVQLMSQPAENMSPGHRLPKDAVIFIAGHRGMVGSAIHRCMRGQGYGNLITRSRAELDLIDQGAVRHFFKNNQFDYVILAAARVGGIQANNTYPADFIYQNLMIESNVIHAAYRSGVRQLLFLGSSCIYPKLAPQPMREECLLSGILEPTNEPYAIAKIAGIKLCESYNRQYATDFRAVMPTNLYGPHDNFDLENSHVLPALIRKYHLAKLARRQDWQAIQKDAAVFGPIPDDIRQGLQALSDAGTGDEPNTQAAVRLWGSGSPRREFLHVDDLAAACLRVLSLSADQYRALSAVRNTDSDSIDTGAAVSPKVSHINVGSGHDLTIRRLAAIIKSTVGFQGRELWDPTKPDGSPQKLLDVTRLKSTGWKPQIELSDGIRNTYDWYLEQTA